VRSKGEFIKKMNNDFNLKKGILRHTHDKVKKSLHLSDEYLNNPTAQCLDLETSHNVFKYFFNFTFLKLSFKMFYLSNIRTNKKSH